MLGRTFARFAVAGGLLAGQLALAPLAFANNEPPEGGGCALSGTDPQFTPFTLSMTINNACGYEARGYIHCTVSVKSAQRVLAVDPSPSTKNFTTLVGCPNITDGGVYIDGAYGFQFKYKGTWTTVKVGTHNADG